jgi:hypothetical protein
MYPGLYGRRPGGDTVLGSSRQGLYLEPLEWKLGGSLFRRNQAPLLIQTQFDQIMAWS